MSLAFGAEIVNPKSSPTDLGGDQYELGVPCAHVGPPGPGFRARIRPAVSAPGRPAYVQVRIPGTHRAEHQAGPRDDRDRKRAAHGARGRRARRPRAAGAPIRPVPGPVRRSGHLAWADGDAAVPAAASRALALRRGHGPGRSRTSARGFEVSGSALQLGSSIGRSCRTVAFTCSLAARALARAP
jgi:hypothetical protein